jgi:DNA-binding MarR family transcriptional regulator
MIDAPHPKQSLRLWLRLLTCATAIEKKARAMLVERFGTTLPRFDVLAALEREPAGLTMSGLSALLLVSNGNVTPIVTRLVADGLVTRTQDRGDRRVLRVKLTAKGRRDFRAMAGEHERWIDKLLGDLGDGEINQLLAGLSRLRTSIERSGL